MTTRRTREGTAAEEPASPTATEGQLTDVEGQVDGSMDPPATPQAAKAKRARKPKAAKAPAKKRR